MTIKAIRINKITDISPEKEREVKATIILLAIFTGAMIIGAGYTRTDTDLFSSVKDLIHYYILKRSEQTFINTFINSLIMNFILTLGIFLSGFSCVGIPATILILILKGAGIGMIAGYLYSGYGISGIGYYLLTILPENIITISVLVLAGNYSLLLSANILSLITGKANNNPELIKQYILKFAVMLILILISAFFDAIMTRSFAYMFKL